MLKIFDDLAPFIEDNYRRINVREYAKIRKISPPTASKLLDSYNKEGLLVKEEDRQYIYYLANKDSKTFQHISLIHWVNRLAALTSYLETTLIDPTIILFGSLSKSESKSDSDIDLAVISKSDRPIDLAKFEARLKRKIHLVKFDSWEDVPKDLYPNIINGFVLAGRL